jgi:hypothetical protein
MNVNLAIARDFHTVDFDPFNIKRNHDILGHGTPRFKITLPGLATICLYWAFFLPFKIPESQIIQMNPLLSNPTIPVWQQRGPCHIVVYGHNYNIFRVINGFGGLLFTI